MFGVAGNVRVLIIKSMKNWNMKITAGGPTFEKCEDMAGNIPRSLLPFMFPLNLLLRINDLLFHFFQK